MVVMLVVAGMVILSMAGKEEDLHQLKDIPITQQLIL